MMIVIFGDDVNDDSYRTGTILNSCTFLLAFRFAHLLHDDDDTDECPGNYDDDDDHSDGNDANDDDSDDETSSLVVSHFCSFVTEHCCSIT